MRGKAQVTITATPGRQARRRRRSGPGRGRPGLLELMPNASWNLLDAMLQRRGWGVETSTAQMENSVGCACYGKRPCRVRAATAAGAPTRELLDTGCCGAQRPADANGQPRSRCRLNDALTSFQIVAVADMKALGLSAPARPPSAPRRTLQIIMVAAAGARRATSSAPSSRCATPRRSDEGRKALRACHAAGAEGADHRHPRWEAREAGIGT